MFAGIGGFRTGLELAGHKCVGFIEWDKYARQSYEAIYDTKGEFTAHDIQQVRGKILPDADIWTFGSPCQDISVAGKQAGLKDGKASSMFFEVIRLLEERIANTETQPSYLIMENVKNLLSSNGGRDFTTVLFEMDKVGYDAEWAVLNSSDVVPQNRERVYIIGHLRGASTRQVFPITGENSSSSEIVRIKRIYNAKSHGSYSRNDIYSSTGLSPTLTATDYRHPVNVGVKQVGNIVNTKSFGGNPQRGRVYSAKGWSPTLNTMQGGGLEPKVLLEDENKLAIRRLTPLECWRLQGFSDEQFYKAKIAGVSDSQLYKQAGNAVTTKVVEQIGKRLGLR